MKQQIKHQTSRSARIVSNKSSRRQFMGKSGRLLAGSVLTGVALPRIYAAQDHTIRLALVGCGGRGTGAVADAFSATGGPVKLCAMADLFEPRLQSSLSNLKKDFADKLDVPPERRFIGFDAYKNAIDCLSPGDVVLLTTHAAFRPMHFEYAVKKGVNVFAEKSFATDAPSVRRWLKTAELSEQKSLKVGVGFMWRHSEARQETIRRLGMCIRCVYTVCMAWCFVRLCWRMLMNWPSSSSIRIALLGSRQDFSSIGTVIT